MQKTLSILGAVLVVLTASCAANHEKTGLVEQARNDFENIANQPYVQQYAPDEYRAAQQELMTLNQLLEDDADDVIIEHQAYVTQKKAGIAAETAKLKRSEEYIAQADAERRNVLANQREQQAEEAKRRVAELEEELGNVKSRQTERGLVLTLSNIVFDVDKAELNPGASLTLDKIAAFLNDYENRNISIEGFTDSSGPSPYNEALSRQRAEAVKQALMARGIDESRIETKGYGEQFPVASNDTTAGRQLNRRVEIVVSNGREVVERRTF